MLARNLDGIVEGNSERQRPGVVANIDIAAQAEPPFRRPSRLALHAARLTSEDQPNPQQSK